MATAKKLPSGKWRCLAYSHTDSDGKRKYKSFTADTKAEAQRLAAEFSASKRDDGTDMTVEQAIARYIDVKRPVLSPATIYLYEKQQRNHYGMVNKRIVSSLTAADVQTFVSDLSLRMSPKSVRNVYGLFSSSVKMFGDKTFDVTLPKRAVIERNIPIDAQVKQLIDSADVEMKLCIALASIGTLRRGEICGLTYKDVKRTKNAIYVHTDLVEGSHGWVHKEMPKTDQSNRYVIFPQAVIDMIGDGEPDERIIKFTPLTLDKRFRKLRDAAGLECRFHDLRHYAASIMHAIGIPDVYIMERGGWKTDTVLKSVYRNSLSDKADQFTDKVNDYLGNALFDENTTRNATQDSKEPDE